MGLACTHAFRTKPACSRVLPYTCLFITRILFFVNSWVAHACSLGHLCTSTIFLTLFPSTANHGLSYARQTQKRRVGVSVQKTGHYPWVFPFEDWGWETQIRKHGVSAVWLDLAYCLHGLQVKGTCLYNSHAFLYVSEFASAVTYPINWKGVLFLNEFQQIGKCYLGQPVCLSIPPKAAVQMTAERQNSWIVLLVYPPHPHPCPGNKETRKNQDKMAAAETHLGCAILWLPPIC